MIPKDQLNKIAQDIYHRIKSAKVTIDGEILEGVIQKKTIEENVVKVFVGVSSRSGTIEKVEIFDEDGDLFQVQEMEVLKGSKYKYLCVVEIRVEGESLRGKY